ncbi:hypothetical protein OSTOST_13509 [Ostertagia ostertagi]
MVFSDTSQVENCTYCYSLQCSVRIESISNVNRRGAVASKNATLTIGRNLARKLVIQLSNCAPRKLNVFLKSLQAKLDIMRSERSESLSTSNRTPLAIARLPSSSKKAETIQLSEEQRAVIRCVLQTSENVFFTGSAGTGKSVVLRRIIEMLPAGSTFVTAATGVAACQLGGITLHSFAGIGVGRGTAEECLGLAMSKDNIVKQWKLCKHLIIDEISMVDADFFTKIEYVARHVREDNRPFGGVKLIVTGDFLQLPPVCGKNDTVKFCFECEAWNRSIQKTIMLKCVHRQDDSRFVKVLQEIRVGKCSDDVCTALMETKENNFSAEGIVPTRLCTHTSDALAVNRRCLEELEGTCKIFEAEDSQYIPDSLQGTVAKKLVLKVHTQVSFNVEVLFRL